MRVAMFLVIFFCGLGFGFVDIGDEPVVVVLRLKILAKGVESQPNPSCFVRTCF